MTITWILVANSSEAHLYESPKAKLFNGSNSLNHVHDYSHPDSRKKRDELVSDKPGRYLNSKGGSSASTYDEPTDPRDHETEIFAKEIADKLTDDFVHHRFQELIIAAPPQFHGMLNKYMKNNLIDAETIHIEKDYTKFTPKELVHQLQNYI